MNLILIFTREWTTGRPRTKKREINLGRASVVILLIVSQRLASKPEIEIIKTTFIITLDSIDFFVTKRILTAVGEHRILLGAPAKGLGAIRNLLYKM